MFKLGILKKRHIKQLETILKNGELRILNDIKKSQRQILVYAKLSTLTAVMLTSIPPFYILFSNQIERYVNNPYIIALLLLLIVAHTFSKIKHTHNENFYRRVITNVFDNMLINLIHSNRVKLAEKVSNLPEPKNVCQDLAAGSFGQHNLKIAIGNAITSLIFITVATLQFIRLRELVYLLSLLSILSILTIFLAMTLVTRKFIKKNKELIQMSDRFDYEFRDRSQLLIPNSINFHDSDIRKKINDIVIQTDKINILQVVGREVFTVLILLITPFIESGNDVQVVLFITTYFLGLTFGALGIVNHFSNISIAEDRLKGLETTFSAIINIQNNMDQSRFDLLKDRIDDTSQAILPIKLQKGLFIQELSLSFGRGVERKKLRIANTHFQPKRFSLITGVSGAGKSVLGRAITLIYGDTVDYNLYLNNKKVTNYQSLYKAQEDLHFSALREFNTSYRNALSAYISNTNINNTFYQEITQFKIQENLRTLSADILNFFEQNHSSKDIDKEYISRILKTDPNPEIIVRDLLSKTFRSMSPYFSYSEELEKLRKVYSENQIRMSELYAFVAQHLAWNQLVRFIPKATFFYMDAVLSEPPISQGQRRRVLLAIDLYITGPLMVIDEPFANLDVETSRSILREIIKYAEENNSVLLIIDHKYKPDIYEGFESRLDKVVKIKEKEDSIVTAKTIS